MREGERGGGGGGGKCERVHFIDTGTYKTPFR